MKTILVTGGSGFIGSHLIDKLLSLGYNVINIDNFNDFYDLKIKENNIKGHFEYNNQYRLIREDITKMSFLKHFLKNEQIYAIIQLAARAGVRPSIENPYQYQVDNVIGTQNILDLAKEKGIKNLVLASSSSVYGNNPKTPFSETDNVDSPISPYAATKKANELQGYTYHHLFGMNIIMLRFFTVYGPRQRPDLAIHKFARLMLEGKPIPFFGDGSTSRDYTYIDDIVQGIILSLNYNENHKNVYEIINLGNNKPVTLKDMVKTIEVNLNLEAKLDKQPMQQGDVNITYADIQKAQKLLGYRVSTTFPEGIKKFIPWVKSIYEKSH
jgi:UDP-glucuronate 4-epimerase